MKVDLFISLYNINQNNLIIFYIIYKLNLYMAITELLESFKGKKVLTNSHINTILYELKKKNIT